MGSFSGGASGTWGGGRQVPSVPPSAGGDVARPSGAPSGHRERLTKAFCSGTSSGSGWEAPAGTPAALPLVPFYFILLSQSLKQWG